MIKERPIIFSTQMVLAILDGRKTQTRRVINPQPLDSNELEINKTEWERYLLAFCPFGGGGDELWVRETFASAAENNLCHKADDYIIYKASDPEYGEQFEHWRWKPSIFMPRAYSRIQLKVINVRVERIQDISEQDAVAEGIEEVCHCGDPVRDHHIGSHKHSAVPRNSAVEEFKDLWDSINAKRVFGWDVNPWVWAVEFERIERGTINNENS